ncbi:hypothetical protein QP421_10565, partial [Streptococcus agalactiae]|nr:hypothetical protein [Streptococcus agalactiae]
CLFRHSQYSPFRLFIVFLRLTSTTGIVYNITHNLESKKNYSGKFNEKNMNFFDSRIGKTKKTIKIIFSDGQEKIQ